MRNSEARPEDSLRSYRQSGALAEEPPLKVAHLSDLHFLKLAAKLPERLKNFLRRHHMGDHNDRVLRALRSKIGQLGPDLIIVSGDLTTLGDRQSLLEAHRFLFDLTQKECGLGVERLVVIPGNHDSLPRYFYIRKSRPYDSVFGCCTLFREIEIRGFPVLIFSFDSSIDRRGEWWPLAASKGRVRADVFIDFNDQLFGLHKANPERFESGLKLAVVHHHPLPVPHKELESFTVMQNGGTFIAHMQSNSMNVVLHGHEHFPYSCSYRYEQNKGDIIVISAGTASQNGTVNNTNTFNFIELHPWQKLTLKQFDYRETGFSENFNGSKTFWFR